MLRTHSFFVANMFYCFFVCTCEISMFCCTNVCFCSVCSTCVLIYRTVCFCCCLHVWVKYAEFFWTYFEIVCVCLSIITFISIVSHAGILLYFHTYNTKTCIFVLQTNRKYYLFLFVVIWSSLAFSLVLSHTHNICLKWMRVDMNISWNDIFVLCVYFELIFFVYCYCKIEKCARSDPFWP